MGTDSSGSPVRFPLNPGAVPVHGPPMTPAHHAALLRGIALFDDGKWFEAHEAWEDAWLESEGLEKVFLQGLIQLAAALHKGLVMNHGPGMLSLFLQANEKLEHVAERGPVFEGFAIGRLHERLAQGLDPARPPRLREYVAGA